MGLRGDNKNLGKIGFTGLESLGIRLDSWRKNWSRLEGSGGNIIINVSNHHVFIKLTMNILKFETAVQ